jgi:protein SCO1/2
MISKLWTFGLAAIVAVMTAALGAEAGTNTTRHACCTIVSTVNSLLTDQSLYQLDSSWTDDNGHLLKLASLRGRPQVVCMFFANCQYACPLLVHRMKEIEAGLGENARTNVGFVLVSFDPERDTPAALHNYRIRNELAVGRWTLLHGSPDDILELAALLGVKFKKDAQGQFMHSNVLTLLNAQGEIASQETGLNLSTKHIIEKLNQPESVMPTPHLTRQN